ncbi:hypothetical protein BDD12DRAFT_802930 [Trichophaea hybrida]|nr:hypothetical protein BDD12DRAFT_802930 [Trichophaea hybrida]
MQSLLDRKPNIEIPEAVVAAAAAKMPKKKLELLINRNPSIEITETVLVEARLLRLNQQRKWWSSIEITETVLAAAAGNSGNMWQSDPFNTTKQMVEMLPNRNPSIEITETILAATVGNSGDRWNLDQIPFLIVEILLSRNHNIGVTKATKEAMELLLKRNHSIKITETIRQQLRGILTINGTFSIPPNRSYNCY